MHLERPAPYDQQEWLNQLAQGDRNAFTRIYTAFCPQLLRYLEVTTQSTSEAEEILQEVFLKLWHKRATLTGVRSLHEYLFRMARNQVFDQRRKEDHRRAYLRTLTADAPATSIEDQLLLKEYHQLVREGLAKMPERRQQIFLLSATHDLTARQIAEQLHLSVPAVKKQLYEAQQFLRKYLQEHGDVLLALLLPTLLY
jgi:RNA polymerase sigma-70 factor (family 1)